MYSGFLAFIFLSSLVFESTTCNANPDELIKKVKPEKFYKFEKSLELTIPQGTIIGNKKSYNFQGQSYPVAEFLGMPYAEPPVGKKRFLRPTKLEKFPKNPFPAQKLGPGCHQNLDMMFADTDLYGDNLRAASYMWNVWEQSEDCLSVNVWTPYPFDSGNSAALKPVMLWLYGGGFFSGGANLDVYLGHRLAALEDVVIVTFNYRVGIFGFLNFDQLENNGNQGLFDQLMAMQWVKENIRFFGGNPDKITLFGESAGGASVGIHVLSPLTVGLFSNVIMQSGSPTAVWAILDKWEVDAKTNLVTRITEKSACATMEPKLDVVECLQLQPHNVLLGLEASLWTFPTKRYLTFPFAPHVDGEFLTDAPLELLRQGKFPDIPVMLGSNRNEGTFFLVYQIPGVFNDFSGTNPLTSAEYDSAMVTAFGTSPQPIFESARFYYRNWTDIENPTSNRKALDDATGEQNFLCPINQFAEFISTAAQKWHETHGKTQVYMYSLQHRFSAENWPEWMGVVHGADCEWIFGKFLDHPDTSEDEVKLTRNIMSHWANFARYGDPNIAGSTTLWPVWKNDTQKTMNLVTDGDVLDPYSIGPRTDRCAFWTKYIPKVVKAISDAETYAKTTSDALTSSSACARLIYVLVSVFYLISSL